MSGWDQGLVTHGDPINQPTDVDNTRSRALERFQHFLNKFSNGTNSIYGSLYRDQLRRRFYAKEFVLEVDLKHLRAFDASIREGGGRAFDDGLADLLQNKPAEFMPLFEDAAKVVAEQVTRPREDGVEVPTIQIVLSSSDDTHKRVPGQEGLKLRALAAQNMSKLVRIQGIVISVSPVRAKATHLTIQCRNCREQKVIPVRMGFGGAKLPMQCSRVALDGEDKCPRDPYTILPDKSHCVDHQVLKLQENPEDVPTGEMPRHVIMSVDRHLTNKVVPGARVTVIGIYDTINSKPRGGAGGSDARKSAYVRVLGLIPDSEGAGRSLGNFQPEEEEKFKTMSRDPEVYKRIAKSIAPSIFGCEDIKKSIACLLFGGSTKILPDNMRLRGDINLLMLGDPGTAKSQLLKFSEKVAPIGVYTSGKGSSAAGLTASVIRDHGSREFYLEGGAMVLADGGVVCIDEFDKMRETDRVAIHEAMEQQTISVAKAGITTTLNSRTSVLAAANSTFGRWDDTKPAEENIDFQSTILSRFDLIFVVKDTYNAELDGNVARHVLRQHMAHNLPEPNKQPEDAYDTQTLKRYVHYCRSTCGPRLTAAASEKLVSQFVLIRREAKQQEVEANGKRSVIPITVRQLEAIVRISESLAKMRLEPYATEEHVDEALRLFKVSTLDAAAVGRFEDTEGMGTHTLSEFTEIETRIKGQFPLGSRVSEATILERIKFPTSAVRKVIAVMVRRGELEYRDQRKSLWRVR